MLGLGDIYDLRQAQAEADEEAAEAAEAAQVAQEAEEAQAIRQELADGDEQTEKQAFWLAGEDESDIAEIVVAVAALARRDEAGALRALGRLSRGLVGRMAKMRVAASTGVSA